MRGLALLRGENSGLLKKRRHVDERPVLGNLSVPDPVDRVARVLPMAADSRDDSVALGKLVDDDVAPRRCVPKELRGLLHALAVGSNARRKPAVADEVGSEKLVENVPIAPPSLSSIASR